MAWGNLPDARAHVQKHRLRLSVTAQGFPYQLAHGPVFLFWLSASACLARSGGVVWNRTGVAAGAAVRHVRPASTLLSRLGSALQRDRLDIVLVDQAQLGFAVPGELELESQILVVAALPPPERQCPTVDGRVKNRERAIWGGWLGFGQIAVVVYGDFAWTEGSGNLGAGVDFQRAEDGAFEACLPGAGEVWWAGAVLGACDPEERAKGNCKKLASAHEPRHIM